MQKNKITLSIPGSPIIVCEDESGKTSKDCLYTLIRDIPLVRAYNIEEHTCSYIFKTAEELQKQKISPQNALRFSFMQLDLPLADWMKIHQQHTILTHAASEHNGQMEWSHLSMPTDDILLTLNPARFSRFDIDTAHKLQKQFNVEVWITYCRWIGSEIKACRDSFKLESLDEYRLQARLDDFLHEIASPLLRNIWQNVKSSLAEQSLLSPESEFEKFFSLEKTIVAGREKMKMHLAQQATALENIVAEINQVEYAHTELHALNISAYLLSTLIRANLDYEPQLNWPQSLLLLQLLNQQLNITSVVNSRTSEDRTNVVYAVRAALMELSQSTSPDKLITLCETWSNENRHDPAAEHLRQLVIACGMGLNANNRPDNLFRKNEWGYNLDLLSFLPEKVHSVGKEIRVLADDSHSGKLSSLTNDGELFLANLRFIS